MGKYDQISGNKILHYKNSLLHPENKDVILSKRLQKKSYFKLPSETSRAVIRIRSVMIYENGIVTSVAKKRTTQLPDRFGRLYPAGSF